MVKKKTVTVEAVVLDEEKLHKVLGNEEHRILFVHLQSVDTL